MGLPSSCFVDGRARALLGCGFVVRRSHTAEGMLAPHSAPRSKIPLASCSYYFVASPAVRPAQNNRSRDVGDSRIRERILKVVFELVAS